MSERNKLSNKQSVLQAAGPAALWLVLLSLLPVCSPKNYTQNDVRQADTVDIRLISVDSMSGLDMAIGQNLSIPDMDIEIVRVSDKEVLVRTPVRTETRTRTTFVPVRKVDKSRTKVDNSVRTDTDNSVRTKTDNDVREVDKSRTKDVDKTRTSERTKTVDKEVTRNGFPWWILILAAVLATLGYLAKKAGKLPFI